VMKVDSFGNLLTTFRAEDLPAEALEKGEVKLHLATHSITKIVPTFASGEAGEAVAYIGSGGYLEVAINKGNASKTLGVGRGAPVVLAKG